MADGSLPFTSVGLIGLGVMGGSLARALSALPRPPRVIGFSPVQEEGAAALAAGVLDELAPDAEALAGAVDLVVYAAPPAAVDALLGRHVTLWRAGAVVTELLSLKAPVRRRALGLGIEDRWVGAHPMAGSEGRGFGASRAELFGGRRVWLCEAGAGDAERARVERFWEQLGACPRWTDALAHDQLMAWASHLPQLTANALALALEAAGVERAELGTGGRDMTRLAASPAEMWGELLALSGGAVAPALRAVAGEMERLAELVERQRRGELEAFLRRTGVWAAAGAASTPPGEPAARPGDAP